MEEESKKQRLLETAASGEAQEALDSLLGLLPEREHDLYRILRPHWEDSSGIYDAREMRLRDGFDKALGRLMLFELAAETGFSGEEIIVAEVTERFSRLLRSPAVTRFIDAYYYFGVRFAAGRSLNRQDRETGKNLNTRSLWLPTPPVAHVPDQFFEEFLNLQERLAAAKEVESALYLLDDYVLGPNEQWLFRLWLRGLNPDPRSLDRFTGLRRGMIRWLMEKADFYSRVQDNAVRARFAVYDIYWLARILGAEVTPAGIVKYKDRSWIHELKASSNSTGLTFDKVDPEEILRTAFSSACDLIQDAVAIASEQKAENKLCREEPDLYQDSCPRVCNWRAVYDAELAEISSQRSERLYRSPVQPRGRAHGAAESRPDNPLHSGETNVEGAWSNQTRTGESITDLIGLAFSGGGIRSATFNLGVLEGLKSLDLLRQVDYLSTVSGGGYIGAWLVANVKRARHWLGRVADWRESIAHLRRYSNYLSPQVGILSADTWTMAGIWGRNTFLVQLMVFTFISCLILASRLLKVVFNAHAGWASVQMSTYSAIAFALIAFATLGICCSLHWNPEPPQKLKWFAFGQTQAQWFIVGPLWVGSFLLASILWCAAQEGPLAGYDRYSCLLRDAAFQWLLPLAGALLCLIALAYFSINHAGGSPVDPAPHAAKLTSAPEPVKSALQRLILAIPVACVSLAALYLQLCGIMLLLHDWTNNPVKYGWFAYVWIPPLIVLAFTLTIVVFLGIAGKLSHEWTREWWTRLGAWLGIYGTGCLGLALVTVYGPLVLFQLHSLGSRVKWPAVLGWAVTTGAGLLAGKSSKASGRGGQRSISHMATEFLAMLGGVLFIAGVLLILSLVLHLILLVISLPGGVAAQVGDKYWRDYNGVDPASAGWTLLVLLACTSLFAWRFDINIFSLNSFYRNRLARCYLGATRWMHGLRKPQKFTGFDEKDDLPLADLRCDPAGSENDIPFHGPFPIVNCALNLGGSSDLALHTRHSASFSLTPLHCGSDRLTVGYVPTREDDFIFAGPDGNPTLGQAVAVSGAAANPNMGYHTSPIVAFLLTLFNVRLGWWFPNPRRRACQKNSPILSLRYLVTELFGLAGEKSLFLDLSDGGHFENLGVYELVRRRCKVIIAADSECDPDLNFDGLGNLIRICEVDFGARIEIDVNSIRKQAENGRSHNHCAVGTINYSNGGFGYLIYLKSSLTGDEETDVLQYASGHDTFPHETTADQFFAEDQFESYRQLGRHVVEHAFRNVAGISDLTRAAMELLDLWTPGTSVDRFIKHSESLTEIWERLRTSPLLHPFQAELYSDVPSSLRAGSPTPEEIGIGCELIKLMENVYLDLRLDDFWEHPDNMGWQRLFLAWVKSSTFREAWSKTSHTCGIRFQYFCRNQLGLN